MNFTHSKLFLLSFLFCCITGAASAQRFFSVVFDKLPREMQLYARADDNLADVPISGMIELAGWDHMSVVTFRNNVRTAYQKSAINYGSSTTGKFSMTPKIKAEMADYSFEVYACHETDSVLIVRRNQIVAGDFYVISGQSNAAATVFGAWSSKYARTIARTPDNIPATTPGDTLWTVAAWSWTYVGAWGLEMQKEILERDSIPTCVINGSLPGAKLSDFLNRDPRDSTSFSIYGGLVKRVRVANPARIRAFVWMHGEQEAFENIGNYAEEYDKLYKNWVHDFPEVEQYVVVQANLIILRNNIPNPVGGSIRDFLRRTKYIYPKTDHFAAIGTPEYDGVHYHRPGYEEFGRRMYHFLAPRIYGSKDSDNVRSPDIKKAFYTNAEKKEIALIFDEGQELKWPADSTVTGQDGKPLVLSLKNFFYLDGDEQKAAFSAGKAQGNQVTLTLKEASTATKLSYLPSFYPENLPLTEPFSFNIAIYTGPYLRNKRGLGAFSFDKVAIGMLLPNVALSANRTYNSVILTWPAVETATSYVLQRKISDSAPYEVLKTLDGQTLSFEDRDIELNATYTYRIQAFSEISQSNYSTVTVDLSPILGNEIGAKNMLWQLFPNPTDRVLRVEFKNAATGTMAILNAKGQILHRKALKASKGEEINVATWPTGTYLLNFQNQDGVRTAQQFIKR
ncbi:Por secretion system C-terminal sorting domain-containing protein [Dyadobacter sp. SG02]|uniref:T9SS type A sorting domain-containing protein n=1 Tax=Dyadobacter sp. SG02 TaxID=1855291 RepID=UPI0008B82232|nr:T9SS type A sorting domain-containing protein [Dyadobacter sp. SG02]SEI88990.1 Por secretion system C-terminal sorting domain-containing protein [Dyadobacter sp. SG02]